MNDRAALLHLAFLVGCYFKGKGAKVDFSIGDSYSVKAAHFTLWSNALVVDSHSGFLFLDLEVFGSWFLSWIGAACLLMCCRGWTAVFVDVVLIFHVVFIVCTRWIGLADQAYEKKYKQWDGNNVANFFLAFLHALTQVRSIFHYQHLQ